MRINRTKTPKPLPPMTPHPRTPGLFLCFSFFHSWGRNNHHFLTSWTESEHLCKSIITDIKWCWWHLEIPYESLTDSVAHRLPKDTFSNLFHTPEFQSWLKLCWPHSRGMGALFKFQLCHKTSVSWTISSFLAHRQMCPFTFLRQRPPAPSGFCSSLIPSSDIK